MLSSMISTRRDSRVLETTQEAAMQSVQLWIGFQGVCLGKDILEILADIDVSTPERLLAHARCERDTDHAVQVWRVVVDIELVREPLLNLGWEVGDGFFAVFCL